VLAKRVPDVVQGVAKSRFKALLYDCHMKPYEQLSSYLTKFSTVKKFHRQKLFQLF
jgi:hypothetical protein